MGFAIAGGSVCAASGGESGTIGYVNHRLPRLTLQISDERGICYLRLVLRVPIEYDTS